VHGEQFNSPWQLPNTTEDESSLNLLLAGDIGVAKRMTTIKYFLEDMSERFENVFYVMGNHEHYGSAFNETHLKIQESIDAMGLTNVHFGTQFSVEIGEYNVIGASLWTDMNKNNPMDRIIIREGMNDYAKTVYRTSSPTQPREIRGMTVDDVLEQHYRDRDFIFNEIDVAIKSNRKIVVMTHHAPSSMSIHPTFQGSALNSAFFTELSDQIMELDYEMVWCHGHVHNSFDYQLGKCRVICNPHGYGNENPLFNRFLTF